MSYLGEDLVEAFPANQIKGLCETYEGYEDLPLLPAFLA